MVFSKTCEYGIRASIHITLQSMQGKRQNIKEIAAAINSPEAFTAKILQQLAKNNIICSVKGPNGGFEIAKEDIETIKLSQIVAAIDGESVFTGCGLGFAECSEILPCPVHGKFKIIREELKNMLESTTLYELSLGLKDGRTFLKM